MAVSCSPLVSFITCGSTSHGLARRAHATRPFSCLPSRKVTSFHGNTCYESCSLSDNLEQPHSRKLRFREVRGRSLRIICSAASFSGGDQAAESDENPYKVLGVNPFETFDKIKAVYAKRQKDAEKRGDEAALTRIEKAYDKIMMAQLANRKQGLTFGSFEVSKDIKYADRQPIVPWGPRYAPSSKRDILINLAISAVFGLWIICTQSADWKPFQFLIFGYMWRVFDKLKDFEKAEPSVSSVFRCLIPLIDLDLTSLWCMYGLGWL